MYPQWSQGVFLFAEELCNIQWPGRIAKRYHYSFIPIWESAFIQWNTILTQRYYNTREPVARNFFLSNTIIDIENKSIRLTLKSSKTVRTRVSFSTGHEAGMLTTQTYVYETSTRDSCQVFISIEKFPGNVLFDLQNRRSKSFQSNPSQIRIK